MNSVWFVVAYSTLLLNIFLIFKSYLNKNLFSFTFFSIWLAIYSIQELIILNDLCSEVQIKYLNVIITQSGFKITSILHFVLVFMFIFLNTKIYSIDKIEENFICGYKCKFLYSLFFFIVLFLFIYKLGGLSNLFLISRPANKTGLSMFIFFFVSTKLFLFASYNKKFDSYFLFLYIISLVVFLMATRLHFLMSILSLLTFVWMMKRKEMGRDVFNYKMLLAIISLPIIFLFLGLIKLKDDSIEMILEIGLLNYFQESFSTLSSLMYFMYTVSIEGFSNVAAFFSNNKLDYIPNFGISHAEFFIYFLPGVFRDPFKDYEHYVNSFTSIEGNVPVVLTQVFESFHIYGLFAFFICVYIFYKIVNESFKTKDMTKFLFYLIILNNSLLFIRGNVEQFIAFMFYDIFGLILLKLLAKKRFAD